jgi:hypothetical protein
MAYAPVLTPFTDDDPCPRVEVFFPEFAEGTSTVTVYRYAAGREYQVRGAVRAATAGALSRIDFECPFNVEVTYRAEMFDAGGLSLGFTDPTTLGDVIEGLAPEEDLPPEEDLAPFSEVVGVGLMSSDSWLHNPLDPRGAVRVIAKLGSAASLSRPMIGSVSRPIGRGVAVALTQGRTGLTNVVWDIHAYDLETADKVQAMLGGYDSTAVPVLCLRVGGAESRVRVPKPFFMAVMDIAEEMQDVQYGGEWTVQRMVGDEAAPPVPGLLIPLLTNADLNAYYATNADLNSDNAANIDVNRKYEIAGYAGGS